MGIIDPSSPLFGASGKIGNVVLYTVGGKTYFRSVPVRKKYEASEAVQAQHGRLAGAQTMYKSVKRGMLKEVFHAEARRLGVRSGYNLFTGRNMRAFGAGEYVDYSLLVLSVGGLQLPFELRVEEAGEGKVVLVWADNSGQGSAQGDDGLRVAYIAEAAPFTVSVLPEVVAVRADGRAEVALPEGTGGRLHLYVFFQSEDGERFSESRYFMVNL